MQDIIAPEIQRNVPDPLHACFIVTGGVGKENKVAARKFASGYVCALRYLCACRQFEIDARAVIKHILHQRRAVVFRLVESRKELSVSVVQTRRAVHVGETEQIISFADHRLYAAVRRDFQFEQFGVRTSRAHICGFVLVNGLVPVAFFSFQQDHIALIYVAERGSGRAGGGTDIQAVHLGTHILVFGNGDDGNVGFWLLGRQRFFVRRFGFGSGRERSAVFVGQ